MIFNNKFLYAIDAVLDIAIHAKEGPIQGREITRRQGIPKRYLENILQELVHKNILKGTRGPRGGYSLAKEKRNVSLIEIYNVIASIEKNNKNSNLQTKIGTKIIFPLILDISKKINLYLRSTTLEDLYEKAKNIEIDKNKITVVGSDNAGVFYGLQSLLALFPADANGSVELPRVEIKDSPRFSYRGMHYDNARNFHGKDAMFKLVEQMAKYKLNTLHWHFSDDEGWRLEIPSLPELAEIGGVRCFDLSEDSCLLTQLGTGPHKDGSGNGYLTKDDFVELLKFAAARHIKIIPEVESPGHARASIKAMEARYRKLMKAGDEVGAKAYLLSDPEDQSEYITVQNYTDNSINACMDSSYNFMEKVTYELQQMYREAVTCL